MVVSKETFAKKGLIFFTEGKYLVYIMVNFCGCHYHFNNQEKKAFIVQKCGKYLALTIIIFKRLYLLVHLIFLLSQWHRRHIFLFFSGWSFPRPETASFSTQGCTDGRGRCAARRAFLLPWRQQQQRRGWHIRESAALYRR